MTAEWDSRHSARFKVPEQFAATGQVIIQLVLETIQAVTELERIENLDPHNTIPQGDRGLRQKPLPTWGPELCKGKLGIWYPWLTTHSSFTGGKKRALKYNSHCNQLFYPT